VLHVDSYVDTCIICHH